MAKITSWQAERYGGFQGQPDLGKAAKSIAASITKTLKTGLPHLPKIEREGSWREWPSGVDFPGSQEWLKDSIARGELPDLGDAGYAWARPTKAAQREAAGEVVVVQMLDLSTKTRHRVVLNRSGDNVLTADMAAWKASLA